MLEEFQWSLKYRPRTIADTILPDRLKTTLTAFLKDGEIPNLILAGPAGVGKTTAAMAMLDELDRDYLLINGSMNGNIDTLRNEIKNFASTMSLTGGRKYVILDEADYINANSTQPALRNFMEEFSKNCGFIMTCNYPNRLIEPLHSRSSIIDFKIAKKELPALAAQIMKRMMFILESENVPYDKAALAGVIKKFCPDWRRTINELQTYSATGAIDSGILSNLNEANFKGLIGLMKERDFTNIRKWVAENIDTDATSIFRTFYDTASQHMTTNSVPQLVLILAKYQYQAAFVADHEINLVACLTEVMIDCQFND